MQQFSNTLNMDLNGVYTREWIPFNGWNIESVFNRGEIQFAKIFALAKGSVTKFILQNVKI